MKFVANVKNLVTAILWATKNYDTKNSRSHVVLSVNEQGSGYFAHENSNSYMKAEFNVSTIDLSTDGVTQVDLALEGTYLKSLANALVKSDGDVTVTKTSDTALIMKTNLGKFTVPLLDFRVSKVPELVELGEVDDTEFFDSLGRIAKLCDAKNSGATSFLGSVDLGLDAANNKITLFATDRYALAQISLDFSPVNSDDDDTLVESFTTEHILLPSASASVVPPTKGLNTSITLVGEKTHREALRFGYSFPDGRLALFALTNTTAFTHADKMRKAVESGVEYDITVNTTALKNAIKVISDLSPAEYAVYLTVDKDGLSVSDANGSNTLTVELEGLNYESDEPYTAKFSRTVINSAFHPVATSDVRLKWGTDSTAFIFEPVTENGDNVSNVFIMVALSQMN